MEKVGRREKLAWCEFLIEEVWMRKIPSKSAFPALWRPIDNNLLEQGIILLGKEITSRRQVKGLAADKFKQESSSFFVALPKMV